MHAELKSVDRADRSVRLSASSQGVVLDSGVPSGFVVGHNRGSLVSAVRVDRDKFLAAVATQCAVVITPQEDKDD